MAKFRKKPMVIDAVRLTRRVTVHTLEGDMVGEPGDWLITGVNGEQYPCKDDVFQKTYEPVVEPLTTTPLPSPDRDPWKPYPWVRWELCGTEFPLTYGGGSITAPNGVYQVWN